MERLEGDMGKLLRNTGRRMALAISKVPRIIPCPHLSYDACEFRARMGHCSLPSSGAEFASEGHDNFTTQQQPNGEAVGYEQKRHVGSQYKITSA